MRSSVTLIESCYFGMWAWGVHLVTRKIWFFDQPKKGIHLCRMILWLDRLMTLECNDVFEPKIRCVRGVHTCIKCCVLRCLFTSALGLSLAPAVPDLG